MSKQNVNIQSWLKFLQRNPFLFGKTASVNNWSCSLTLRGNVLNPYGQIDFCKASENDSHQNSLHFSIQWLHMYHLKVHKTVHNQLPSPRTFTVNTYHVLLHPRLPAVTTWCWPKSWKVVSRKNSKIFQAEMSKTGVNCWPDMTLNCVLLMQSQLDQLLE